MKIELRSRLLPFSHLPGIECIVPFSDYSIQVFPAFLRIRSNNQIEDIVLSIEGPVKNFTVIQNLEKGEIQVFGENSSGLIRYTICFLEGKLHFIPQKGVMLSSTKLLSVSSLKSAVASSSERLHLGQHKALDWELVKRRCDLKEIFPIWHRLGQLIPKYPFNQENSLFQECYNAVEQRKKHAIQLAFKNLFSAGFQGIMVPRVEDLDYLGFTLPPTKNHPFVLLSEGAKLIRSLFVSFEEGIELLPCLPQEIVSGRFCNLQTSFATIDLEWSKRAPRRMVLKAIESKSLVVIFPKNIRKARLRLNDNDKGIMVSSKSLLDFEQGTHYYFDQFAH